MPKIETLKLRVSDVEAQCRFYCDILGMRELTDGCMGYGGDQAQILFLPAQDRYAPQANDLYWKIALAVPNIELACAQLSNQGIEVGSPKQFQEVGYLAHFNDPAGFTIELIEHWFKGDRPEARFDTACLGGGAHLNLITLRSADIASVENQLTHWGMTLLSVQPVLSHGFTLHFYAFTSDIPPSADLRAIENRTWLYQKSYTILELQHVHNLQEICLPAPCSAGFAGIGIAGANANIQSDDLLISTD